MSMRAFLSEHMDRACALLRWLIKAFLAPDGDMKVVRARASRLSLFTAYGLLNVSHRKVGHDAPWLLPGHVEATAQCGRFDVPRWGRNEETS